MSSQGDGKKNSLAVSLGENLSMTCSLSEWWRGINELLMPMKANYRPSGMREAEKEMGGCIEEADRGRDVSAEICQDQKMSLLPYRYFHKQQRERSSLWKPKHHDLTVRKCADNPQTYTQSCADWWDVDKSYPVNTLPISPTHPKYTKHTTE